MNKAVFLDRDGVINKLVYHDELGTWNAPFNPDEFEVLPHVGQAINQLHDQGYRVIVVSNQPDIALGLMAPPDFDAIRNKMKQVLARSGAYLDGEYYCLHHPRAVVAALRIDCGCKKPKPGLLLQAAAELQIDRSQSWMIGDRLVDISAGVSAGTRTIMVKNDQIIHNNSVPSDDVKPETTVGDLTEAVAYILNSIS